jgi:hypothetical protein
VFYLFRLNIQVLNENRIKVLNLWCQYCAATLLLLCQYFANTFYFSINLKIQSL